MNSTVPRFFNLLFRVQRLILNITQEKKDLFFGLLHDSTISLTEPNIENVRYARRLSNGSTKGSRVI